MSNVYVLFLRVVAPYPIVFGSLLAGRCSEMQAFNLSDNLAHRGPATKIETQQLKRAFAWGAADPQADEETSNQRHVDLQLYAILTVTEQMPTAQNTFEPAEEEFNRPPISVRQRNEVGL